MRKNTQSKSSVLYTNKDALFDGESNLPRYNQSIAQEFVKFFLSGHAKQNFLKEEREVLDFGAGSGSLAEILQDQHGFTPICIEIDPEFQALLQEKSFICYNSLNNLKKKYRLVYSSNVLEHIEDDTVAIRELCRAMTPGGQIGVYVHAMPFLYSSLDRQAGHFRRYKKVELVKKFQESGFKIDQCFYNDCLGVPASIALKIFGYRNRIGLGSSRSLAIYDK